MADALMPQTTTRLRVGPVQETWGSTSYFVADPGTIEAQANYAFVVGMATRPTSGQRMDARIFLAEWTQTCPQ